ncbi:MAG: magnesium transporter CorA family protein, partial [Candidatus Kaiserbacteria bacterium]|nr:magnesium transporter CorA family protein [Candidatus Kaiserbacteria bacterium]
FFFFFKDAEFKEISELRNGVWIHAESPSEAELLDLAKRLELDVAILEDARDFFEVPRLERSHGVTYFFTRYPYNEPTEDIDTAPLLIVMGETFVLTITLRPVPQFDAILKGKIEVHTTQKTKLFIQLMEVITLSFERQLISLRRAVHKDRAELRAIGNKEIVRFVNYEHRLNDMVAALLPTNVALQQVMHGQYFTIREEDKELMDDLRIDNVQAVDSARTLLKTLQNVRSASEAILTNNLNNRIKTLTVLTILLTVPTIVSSLFGMNVPLPLAEQPYAFEVVLLVVAVLVAGGVWYFKKHEWF